MDIYPIKQMHELHYMAPIKYQIDGRRRDERVGGLTGPGARQEAVKLFPSLTITPKAFKRNPKATREIPGHSLSRGPATLRTPICFFSSQFRNDDGSADFFRSMISDGFWCLLASRTVKAVPPIGLPQVRIKVPSDYATPVKKPLKAPSNPECPLKAILGWGH
jgi:hypothetical protein